MAHDESVKNCWICFVTSVEDETAEWIKPCKCRGTVKWVHQNCLQCWLDVKQNSTTKTACNRCGVYYVIQCPPLPFYAATFENIYKWIVRSCGTIGNSIQLVSLSNFLVVRLSNVTFSFPTLSQSTNYAIFDRLLCVSGLLLFLSSNLMVRLENQIVSLLVNKDQCKRLTFGANNKRDDIMANLVIVPFAAKCVASALFWNNSRNPVRNALVSVAVVSTVKLASNVCYKYLQLWRAKRRLILNYNV